MDEERKNFPRKGSGEPRGRDAAGKGGARGDRPSHAADSKAGGKGEGARQFAPKQREGQGHAGGFKGRGEKKPFRKHMPTTEEPAGERIAKRLARAGMASRRDSEELILAGRVSVNGRKLDTPAVNVMPTDRIEVDGIAIPAIERTRLFLFHKPAGVVTTTRDPEGRRTVFDTLPSELPRLMTVGRLDINTEGLLLLTNDGGLARVLELPSTGWLRRYRVRVHGKVDEKALVDLKDGIAVDGVFYGAVEASLDREQGTNAWISIGLREGKNREVRNILGALGLEVTRLIRISFGPFQLGELPEGHVLEINGRMLRDQLGERLIEDAGANFDAPVISQFSNRPVSRSTGREGGTSERPKPRHGNRESIGEGGLIKGRRRRTDVRDDALDRLSTRRDGGGPAGDRKKPRPAEGGKRGREQFVEPVRQRKANVWMAPGARPLGAGRVAAEKAETEAKRQAKQAFRAPRADRQGSDKPRGERSQGDRPDGDRPSSYRGGSGKPGFGKPRGERPQGDKPGGDGPSNYRGGSGKPGFGKPRGERPQGDRPGGDGPSSYRSGSGKAGFGKPRGERPQGGKPGTDRLKGSKPGSSSRSGPGKPQGRDADRRR